MIRLQKGMPATWNHKFEQNILLKDFSAYANQVTADIPHSRRYLVSDKGRRVISAYRKGRSRPLPSTVLLY